ncbi:MAG TPA: hypothetical protein VFT74_01090 [Isosphaeraceae bacterium]|nr:hypothetical protein [Isosphaeraceae bacterium]
MRREHRGLPTLLLLFLAPGLAWADPQFQVSGLPTSDAVAINSQGQVLAHDPSAPAGSYARLDGYLPGPGQFGLSSYQAIYTTGRSFNHTGQAAGQNAAGQAVISQNGTNTVLGTLGGSSSASTALNETGQTVGWAQTASGSAHAFEYQNGKMIDLGTLSGGQFSASTDVNGVGVAVGYSDTGRAPYSGSGLPGVSHVGLASFVQGAHAVEFTSKGVVDIGTLGGSSSIAHGLNDAGLIVGSSQTADGSVHAFVSFDGKMADLGTLGFSTYTPKDVAVDTSEALAVNNVGSIVGESNGLAFLDQNGVMFDLNSLIPRNSGLLLRSAIGINDAGQILALGGPLGQAGYGSVYVLTPSATNQPGDAIPTSVPEPSPLILLTVGVVVGVLLSRRTLATVRPVKSWSVGLGRYL